MTIRWWSLNYELNILLVFFLYIISVLNLYILFIISLFYCIKNTIIVIILVHLQQFKAESVSNKKLLKYACSCSWLDPGQIYIYINWIVCGGGSVRKNKIKVLLILSKIKLNLISYHPGHHVNYHTSCPGVAMTFLLPLLRTSTFGPLQPAVASMRKTSKIITASPHQNHLFTLAWVRIKFNFKLNMYLLKWILDTR